MGNTPSTDTYTEQKSEAFKQAKTAILASSPFSQPSAVHLTEQQIDLVLADCYAEVSSGHADEDYLKAAIYAVIIQTVITATKSEVIKKRVESLLAIAAISIKGMNCSKCSDRNYYSSCMVSLDLHEYIVDAIQSLLDLDIDEPSKWSLSYQAKFSLDKLCLMYDDYLPLRYCSVYHKRDQRGMEDVQKSLEEMWCHQAGDEDDCCRCWDEAWNTENIGHGKYCSVLRWSFSTPPKINMGNTTSLFAKNPFARTKPPPRSQSKPRMSPNTSLGFSHSLLIRWLATLSYDDVQLFVLALVANDFDCGNFTLPADYIGDEERLMMTMSDKDVQCIVEHCTAGVLQGCASEEYIMAVLFIVVDQAEREGLMATIRFLDDLLRLAFYIKEGATGPIDISTRHLHLDIIEAMENLYQIGIEDVPAWEGYERSEEMDRMLDSLCQHFRYYKSVRNLAVHWSSMIIPGGPEAEDGSKSMAIRD